MTKTPRFSTAFISAATAGTLVGQPGGTRVLTDSREPMEDALFLALSGPRFDGHDFVRDALDRGAAGVVVSAAWWGREQHEGVNDALVVPDTLLALQDLARAHRDRVTVPLVAITGSNGKTTTKELTAAALGPLGAVHRTVGNLNNHIGLPLTLLDLDKTHRVAVVEIGLNHPGELRLLSKIARPQAAVITNVAAAHLEGLGTLAGVARAKAEILEGLEPGGTLIVPAASPELERALAGYHGPRITFGLDHGADLHPEHVELLGWDGARVTLPGGVVVETQLIGEHAVRNLLAALAAAGTLGISPAAAAPGIAAVSPVAGRLCPRKAGGVVVVDDSYNANPTSLTASLEALRMHSAGRTWAVLGDMLELGKDARALHTHAGTEAAFLDGLVTVGELAAEIGAGAVRAGLDPGRHRTAEDGAVAAALLISELRPGDAVLVKGSRGIRLEQAVDRLLLGLGGES